MSQAEEIEKLTVDVQTLEIDFRDVVSSERQLF